MIALAVLRRLLVALATLAGVAVVVFVLLRVVPGDPVAMMISPGASQADIAALRAHYGLDGSCFRSLSFGSVMRLRGDFGISISLHRDVLALLRERLPATLELAIAALEFAVILGGAVAIVGAMARRTWLEAVHRRGQRTPARHSRFRLGARARAGLRGRVAASAADRPRRSERRRGLDDAFLSRREPA